MSDDLSDILSLFRGRCGHQWVGATGGSFGAALSRCRARSKKAPARCRGPWDWSLTGLFQRTSISTCRRSPRRAPTVTTEAPVEANTDDVQVTRDVEVVEVVVRIAIKNLNSLSARQ